MEVDEGLAATAEGAARPGVLIVYSGRQPRYEPLPLGPDGTLTLGREALAGLELRDESLAPRHALVRWTAGGFSLQDLGTAEGTFLGGERLDLPVHGLRRGLFRMGSTFAALLTDVRRCLPGRLHPEGDVAGPRLQEALQRAELAGQQRKHLVLLSEVASECFRAADRYHAASKLSGPLEHLIGEGYLTTMPGLPGAVERSAESAADGVVMILSTDTLSASDQSDLLGLLTSDEGPRPGSPPRPGPRPRIVAAFHKHRPGDLVSRGRFSAALYRGLAQCVVELPVLPAFDEATSRMIEYSRMAGPDVEAVEELLSLAEAKDSAESRARAGAVLASLVDGQRDRAPGRSSPRCFAAVDRPLQREVAPAEENEREGLRRQRARARGLTADELEDVIQRHDGDRGAAAHALALDPVEFARLLLDRGVGAPRQETRCGPPDPRRMRQLIWAASRYELRADADPLEEDAPEVTSELGGLEALLREIRPAVDVALDRLEEAGWTFRVSKGRGWLGTSLDLSAVLQLRGFKRLRSLSLETAAQPFLEPAEAQFVVAGAVAAARAR